VLFFFCFLFCFFAEKDGQDYVSVFNG